jgi:hypothetical protein
MRAAGGQSGRKTLVASVVSGGDGTLGKAVRDSAVMTCTGGSA